jgi:hypothetical protein
MDNRGNHHFLSKLSVALHFHVCIESQSWKLMQIVEENKRGFDVAGLHWRLLGDTHRQCPFNFLEETPKFEQ